MANPKFRQIAFRNNDPYAGGVCILEDGTAAWAVVDAGNKRLFLEPLIVEDKRPKGPSMMDVVDKIPTSIG